MKLGIRVTASVTLLVGMAALPASVAGVPVLAVDFGTAGDPPQDGFLEMAGSIDQATANASFGTYTVGLAGQGFGTATNSNAAAVIESVRPLFRDYYFNDSDVNGEGVALSIGGVTPNTQYNLTLWSYDADQLFSSTDTVWMPSGSSTGTGGFVTNFADPRPETLTEYSATIQISSSTSTLDVFGTTTSGFGGTRLNGFKLDDGVADLLAIDFGQPAAPPSPVQAAFHGMPGNFPIGNNSPPPSATSTFGSYTVTVTGDPYQGTDYTRVGFEDTAAGASAIDPSIRFLYEDAAINNLDLNDGSGLTIAIEGVTPNTQYSLKLWSYNADNTIYSTPTLFSPLAGSETSGTSGSVTQFATPIPTTLDDYSTTILVSSTTDTLHIHAASTDNFGGTRVNGFELSLVSAALPGDYNGDGTVNAADYAVWRDTLGSTTDLVADGNGSNAIDSGDYTVWVENFGFSGSGALVAAPEPASLVLLVSMVCLGTAALRRRGRK